MSEDPLRAGGAALLGEPPEQALPPNPLDERMEALASRLRGRGFAGLAFVRPDPYGVAGERLVQALSSAALQAHAEWMARAVPPRGGTVERLSVEALGDEAVRRLGGLGYQQLLLVRLPLLGEACGEFWLLSTSAHLREEQLGTAALEVLGDWPAWREALRAAVCPLTPREREVLRAVAEGLKGSEAQQRFGCTERTFRLHVENAKRKLRAANGAQAVYRAQLMGGL